MAKPTYKIVFKQSEANKEFYVQIFHKNKKEILKETYKNKAAVIKITKNLFNAIASGDYELDSSAVDKKKK